MSPATLPAEEKKTIKRLGVKRNFLKAVQEKAWLLILPRS